MSPSALPQSRRQYPTTPALLVHAGKPVGPLRVWPGGLAMSRSIGDAEAEDRVRGEPEICQVRWARCARAAVVGWGAGGLPGALGALRVGWVGLGDQGWCQVRRACCARCPWRRGVTCWGREGAQSASLVWVCGVAVGPHAFDSSLLPVGSAVCAFGMVRPKARAAPLGS